MKFIIEDVRYSIISDFSVYIFWGNKDWNIYFLNGSSC